MTTAYNRGNSYLVLGRFEEALNEFNRAAELGSSSSDVFLSRGIAEEKLLQWEDAISDYRKANELFRNKQFPFPRDDPTAISNLANAETGLNRWTEAYADFTKAASLNPDFLAPQIGRYIDRLSIQSIFPNPHILLIFTTAISSLLSLFPNLPIILGKALVAYQLNRPQETFAFFQKLQNQYPTYADANAALATLYWEKGDIVNGNECWEDALEEDRY